MSKSIGLCRDNPISTTHINQMVNLILIKKIINIKRDITWGRPFQTWNPASSGSLYFYVTELACRRHVTCGVLWNKNLISKYKTMRKNQLNCLFKFYFQPQSGGHIIKSWWLPSALICCILWNRFLQPVDLLQCLFIHFKYSLYSIYFYF